MHLAAAGRGQHPSQWEVPAILAVRLGFCRNVEQVEGADLLGLLLVSGNGSGNHREPRWMEQLSDKVHKMARADTP